MSSDTGQRLSKLLKEKNELLAQRERLIADLHTLDGRIADVTLEYGRTYNEERPISKIPNELLHDILHLVKAESDPSEELNKHPEQIFAAVCAQWRQAMLSFGDLWNSFRTSHPSDNAHNRLVACLERSGTFPLDLWFDFRPVGLLDLPDGFHLLQDSIGHIHRWRSFTVLTEIDSPIIFLSAQLADKEAPLLEHLTLLPYRQYDFEPPDKAFPRNHTEAIALTGGTPKLSYLCLNDLSGSIFSPPLTTITDLRLDMIEGIENSWMSWSTFLQILQLPSLTTVSLVGQHFEPAAPPIPRIRVPTLKHLRYASLASSDFVDLILPNLDAPRLTTLTLKDLPLPSDTTYWARDHLKPFPKLRTLVLIDFEFYLKPFAYQLCSLTSKISTMIVADGLGEWLPWAERLRRTSTRPLWPNAETVVLDIPRGLDMAYKFKLFLQRHPNVRKVYIPEETRFEAKEIMGAVEALAKEDRDIDLAVFHAAEAVDPCLGPWPPGSEDSGDVDDPFWFDIG